MQRTFKTRLKVNDHETNILAQWCGISRLAYNTCLDQWNEDYANGVARHNYYSIKKWFNSIKRERFPFITTCSKWVPEAAIKDHVPTYGETPAIPQKGNPRLVPYRRLRRQSAWTDADAAEGFDSQTHGKVQI